MHKEQVRIQSDGTGPDTVVTTADGRVIPGIRELWLRIESDEVSTVDITLLMPSVDAHAHPREVTFSCPFCSESLTHECKDGDTFG